MTEVKKRVVELRDVAVYYNAEPFSELSADNYKTQGEKVLEHINLSVSEGELVYLIGRVGSGKSSLLKILYGELSLFEGSGYVADFNLRNLKRSQIPMLRRNIGIVFQELQLLSGCNVFENLAFVLRATGWSDKHKIGLRIDEVLTQVGLENRHNRMPFELSGGERQRLMIARALLNMPKIILADEPTGNLDPVTAESIVKLFHTIAASGTTVIMSTHNTAFIEEFPARTLLFSQGHINEVNFDDFEQC